MSDVTIRATWAGEHRFDTGRPDGPVARLDGSAETGQSPVHALASALAACAGTDVVDILGKRRTPPARLVVEVRGMRRAEPPRRVTSLEIDFMIDGEAVERVHAERAVTLAFEKYCSVSASLAGDIVMSSCVVLNGEVGGRVVSRTADPSLRSG